MKNLVVNFFGEYDIPFIKDLRIILKKEGVNAVQIGSYLGPWNEENQFANMGNQMDYLEQYERKQEQYVILNSHPLLLCDYYNRIGDIDKEWRTIVRTIFSQYNNLNILLDRNADLKIGAYLQSYGYLYTRFNLDESNAGEQIIKLIKEKVKS